MIDKIFKTWEQAKPYLIPFFLLPLLVVFLIDYLVFLLWVIQICIICCVSFVALGFLVGVYVYIQTRTSVDKPALFNLRVVKVVPSIGWGYNMMDWLMSENIDVS